MVKHRPIRTFRSVRRRAIHVYSVGRGPSTVMVMAGVHGDETVGVDVVRCLLDMLSEMSDEAMADVRMVLIPRVNPDGCAAGTRQNARGVDINRNFPEKNFGTGEKSKKYYCGEAPASEPETRAIMSAVAEFEPSLIISLHAPLACVNYNGPSLRIARRISRITGLPAVGDIGYPCPGSMGNYYGRERRLPLITLELPEGEIDPAKYARALLEALEIGPGRARTRARRSR